MTNPICCTKNVKTRGARHAASARYADLSPDGGGTPSSLDGGYSGVPPILILDGGTPQSARWGTPPVEVWTDKQTENSELEANH